MVTKCSKICFIFFLRSILDMSRISKNPKFRLVSNRTKFCEKHETKADVQLMYSTYLCAYFCLHFMFLREYSKIRFGSLIQHISALSSESAIWNNTYLFSILSRFIFDICISNTIQSITSNTKKRIVQN